jgi:D-glycero-alpha-D-manno-heptose-7-phosphate kinase
MRAPTRMDFGGGWTDVPPYSEREGGTVCSAAIARYATVRVTERPLNATLGTPLDSDRRFADHDVPLIDAALRRANLLDRVGIEIRSDFPVAAGLGGSSAATAALLGALDVWEGVSINRAAIAERGREIEVEDLGIAGGRQDHYAATHGGLLGLSFSTAVRVERIPMPQTLREGLEERCVLIYTGESRVSGSTISAVLEAYRRGERGVTFALSRMRQLALEMIQALYRADVDTLGALVGEHWTHQRALSAWIPTPRIDSIIECASRAGALGAKAMGASGGGCVLVVAQAGRGNEIRAALAELGQAVPFTIDEAGLTACEWNAATP